VFFWYKKASRSTTITTQLVESRLFTVESGDPAVVFSRKNRHTFVVSKFLVSWVSGFYSCLEKKPET